MSVMRRLLRARYLCLVLFCGMAGCGSPSEYSETAGARQTPVPYSQVATSAPTTDSTSAPAELVASNKFADLQPTSVHHRTRKITYGDPPPPVREFRGLWVATVGNSDWPDKGVTDPQKQKQELLGIFDHAAAAHLNVIVLQVRPSCDALYDSRIEPWSEYLTGRMGQPPSPYYDPLQFAVTEAHKRGLELHAWFNPYRVRLRELKTPVSSNHISVRHPELVRTYGKYLWLDPAEQGTQDYSLSVVMDVVRRYDIDGVHFDDYFYPYPEKSADGTEINFPDDGPWHRYLAKGGKLPQSDWRRENVNKFVRSVYTSIKHEKPWVKFGLSPFGIWRPKNPAQIAGFDAYDKIYCDARSWLAEGCLDYCAPQLYWPIDPKAQSFPALLQWWSQQNPLHKMMLAGMMVGGWRGVAPSDEPGEFAREIEWTRQQHGISGQILWHARPLFHEKIAAMDELATNLNAHAALVPSINGSAGESLKEPHVIAQWEADTVRLHWEPAGTATIRWWVVQTERAGQWKTQIYPGEKASEDIHASADSLLPDQIAVTAVDRFGRTSRSAMSRQN